MPPACISPTGLAIPSLHASRQCCWQNPRGLHLVGDAGGIYIMHAGWMAHGRRMDAWEAKVSRQWYWWNPLSCFTDGADMQVSLANRNDGIRGIKDSPTGMAEHL